jgi:hypothetical protein
MAYFAPAYGAALGALPPLGLPFQSFAFPPASALASPFVGPYGMARSGVLPVPGLGGGEPLGAAALGFSYGVAAPLNVGIVSPSSMTAAAAMPSLALRGAGTMPIAAATGSANAPGFFGLSRVGQPLWY